jgi:hypothetical protein
MNEDVRTDRPLQRTLGWILVLACALFAVHFALGPSLGPAGRARADATTDATTHPVEVRATAAAEAGAAADDTPIHQAGSADAVAAANHVRIRTAVEQQAAKVSPNAMVKAETKLETLAHRVDANAATQGNAAVAGRLAARFDMTVEELLAEQAALDASWGQLMIAHALAAKAFPVVTAAELIAMHEDGMGWGKIAAGLGIKLGSAVSAVRSQANAAQGARADGRVSAARGEGARAGMRGSMAAGLGVGHGRAGVGMGPGMGLKLGH